MSGISSGSASVQQGTGPELRIEAPDDLAPIAARIRRLEMVSMLGIVRLVGLSDAGAPITVVLSPEGSDLAKSTPEWIAGFAHGTEGVIVLFPARSPNYPYESLEDVLRHEVAHVLIARAAGRGVVPRWFHEGLALAAERPWGFEDRTRVVLASARWRFSTRDIDAAFHGGQASAARAYALAGALVRDLLRRHGSGAPARVLSRLAAGDSFDEAFRRATGETVAASEEAFWRDNWWSQVVPFLTSSVVLWIGVTFLALYAIRTRRVRRAARRKAWEEEEERPALRDWPPVAPSGDEEGEEDEEEEKKESGPTIH